MGFLSRASSIASMPRARASTSADYNQAWWSGDSLPDLWLSSLAAAGVPVSPDLAMTLSAYRCGVLTYCYDLGTLPLRAFKNRADGGKDLVVGGVSSHAAGIGALIYKLQWQPNLCQTSVEFFVSMIAQFMMRNIGYAEIVPGPSGFLEQLLPRHPDRVKAERLPSGRLRYKLSEPGGGTRYVTQDEMFVIRDLSTDGGLSVLSRVAYGANTIGTGLAAERAAGKFFKSGMTAATVATYTGGQMDDEAEAALHRSISRYAAGMDNSFGLMLIPDDVKVSNLAIEPEKAQMMLAREWTVYEVARDLRLSPRKLMVRTAGATGYASAYQDGIDHVVNSLRPIAVLIQQSVQRDLVLAKDTYSFVFHLGELLKGDPAQMGEFIEKLIASRAMTPSEVRTTYLDMNPDEHLDQLSEGDNRPGSPKGHPAATTTPSAEHGRVLYHAMMAVQDNAVRCLRRERAAVEKLALKHATDPVAWQAGLRDFYADHAGFVAHTMRIPIAIARGFVAEHGTAFEDKGVTIIADAAGAAWEHQEAHALALLSVQTAEHAA
jgi:HK97 family phage portal protein